MSFLFKIKKNRVISKYVSILGRWPVVKPLRAHLKLHVAGWLFRHRKTARNAWDKKNFFYTRWLFGPKSLVNTRGRRVFLGADKGVSVSEVYFAARKDKYFYRIFDRVLSSRAWLNFKT